MRRWLGLIFSCFVSVLFGKPLTVEVLAPSAIVMNAETGAILYTKNHHERRHPASITKIATALYVLEKKGDFLDGIKTTATREALMIVPTEVRQAPDTRHPPYRLEYGGTSMGLLVGEEHTLRTLLYGLMLPSGNDAANVLAEHMSGSVNRFMQELNGYLKGHGMRESHFVSPHGLQHPDHWTTAYDMAVLTQKALQHPTFREIVKAARYPCPKSSKQPARDLLQHNRLVKPGAHFYSKAIGVKIGSTLKSGRTLVAAATHEGRELIAVLLGCSEGRRNFTDAVKLFEAAFAEKLVTRVLFAKGSDRFSHAVSGAKASVNAVLKEDLVLQYFPAEEPTFRAEIEWLPCKLPIRAQESVGFLRLVTEEGVILKQLPLVAAESVSPKWWLYPILFFKTHKTIFMALFLGAQVTLLLFYFLKKNQKIRQR